MDAEPDATRAGWVWSPDDWHTVLDELGRLLIEATTPDADGPAVVRPDHDLIERWAEQEWPESGMPAAEVLARFAAEIAPHPFGNAHPRFAAWVNSPPHPVGVLGSALAAAMNPSVAGGNHAAVHIEHQVLRWFAELLGWQQGYAGLLVSGGSAATLTALAVARHRALARVGVDDRKVGLRGVPAMTVYASPEAHSCLVKAVETLGIGSDNLIRIPARGDGTLDPSALRAAVRRDLSAHIVPVAVVASVGTVNTGAIDPIDDIATVAAEYNVWLHVDGSYGAPPVLLTDNWPTVRAALMACDSIALDPHKWLYTPVDAGVVLVRDGVAGRDTFSLVPPYLRTSGDADEPVWFAEYGLEQTRPFRALKIWAQLMHLGRSGYRHLISRDLAVAGVLRDALAAATDFEVLAHGLSVVCFQHRPVDVADLDAHNCRLLEVIQARGAVYLAGTTVDGAFALRACIVNPGTTTADVHFLINELRHCGALALQRDLP